MDAKKLKTSHNPAATAMLQPPLLYDDDKNLAVEPCDVWRFNVSRTIMFKLHKNIKMEGDTTPSFLGIDLDGTIIHTKSGKQYSESRDDWKLASPSVDDILQDKVNEGNYITIISNQSGLLNQKAIEDFQFKVDNILDEINVPVDFICSLKYDFYRKPNSGMVDFMCHIRSINLDDVRFNSYYIGDAAGRAEEKLSGRKKDFNNTDYKLALNCGINFLTPEVFFLKSKLPRNIDSTNWLSLNESNFFLADIVPTSRQDDIHFEKPDTQEIMLLVGPAASGKSTLARKFENLGYCRINQDILKTFDICLNVAEDYLRNSKSICIDNTNITRTIRSRWISLAKSKQIPIKCVYMKTEKKIAMVLREFRLIDPTTRDEDKRKIDTVVMHSHYKQIEIPSASEGFDKIMTFDFLPDQIDVIDLRVKRLLKTYIV